eukprot:3888483-Amphidinium_carterae.3
MLNPQVRDDDGETVAPGSPWELNASSVTSAVLVEASAGAEASNKIQSAAAAAAAAAATPPRRRKADKLSFVTVMVLAITLVILKIRKLMLMPKRNRLQIADVKCELMLR